MTTLLILSALLALTICVFAFLLLRARADGRAAQLSTDTTLASHQTHAMLDAALSAPRTADALDRSLRSGEF